ncbi:MAG: RecQ family ATP-dependent DNA helicase [Paludibacteraceae bacterium]
MQKYLDILKTYWGYDSFRPLQSEIIQSIASGNDTLGLMPTGGGKSLTFQVPALAMDGICIVVTPLIALMKDQVENLREHNIRAAVIYSGMTHTEIIRTLDNAVFDAYKFLYVSPERLGTDVFMKKVKQMNVCMIAVDEAHCISQWGYDFRPSYLKIADIRLLLPEVPVLALTATATVEVVDDIQNQLKFRQKNVFKKSFLRSNLAYVVRNVENKEEQLLKILKNVPGSSVVYVRNRKKTKEIADFLSQNGVKAEHFHAGLKNTTKDERQARWKSGKTRVIVATNAFGMGIDKSDVRTVVHMDLPDSLEAYFQEAGRAGRDEKKAYAVLLFNKTDETKLRKRVADTFPPKEKVKEVYTSLGGYYQVGVGSGLDRTFVFDINDFCIKFHFPILVAYNSIKILQQAEYLELTDEQDSSSMITFTLKKDELYGLKNTTDQEKLIHMLLRSYTGLFTDLTPINEETVAKRLGWKQNQLYEQLSGLAHEHVIKYIPRRKTPYLTFVQERESAERLFLSKEAYDERKERYVKRVKCVLDYAKEENVCRSRILLDYFGEKDAKACGKCDVCQRKRERELSEDEFQKIRTGIESLLSDNKSTVNKLINELPYNENKILTVLRYLIDNKCIIRDERMNISLIKC